MATTGFRVRNDLLYHPPRHNREPSLLLRITLWSLLRY